MKPANMILTAGPSITEKEINTAKNKEGAVAFKKYLDDGEIIIRYLYSEEAPRDEDAEARLVFWNDT